MIPLRINFILDDGVTLPKSRDRKKDGDKYELTLQAQVSSLPFDEGKKSATVSAEVRDGRLYLTTADETIVMEKF